MLAVVGAPLLGFGVFLLSGAGTAQPSADAYDAAEVCQRPEPVTLTSCVAEVPATVSDEDEHSSRNSTTYDVQLRFGDGATQWAHDIDEDFYRAVDIGTQVHADLWNGDVTAIDDGKGHATSSEDEPMRRAHNGLLLALVLTGCGLFVLGYAQLAWSRRRLQGEPPPSTAVPVPDLASWLRLAGMCLFVGMAVYLLVAGLHNLALGVLVAVFCIFFGLLLALVLRASMQLSLSGAGLAMRGWALPPATIAYPDIKPVRRGHSISWRAGGKALPLFRLRFATARNEAFTGELQRHVSY
ncbi:MAG: hypothetical protein ABR498_01690 [Candidatus Dormibacteria bacterium]